VATRGRTYWLAHGQPWRPARPIRDLAQLLRGYGYAVGTIGNDEHLRHMPPEDHTPFSATGWPVAAAFGVVWAGDIMPPKHGLPVPSLAELGAQLFADRQANDPGAAWIKYMNWTDGAGHCVHDSWTPGHVRRASDDRGHIHVSARSDCGSYVIPAGYDPVARIRGKSHEQKPQPRSAPTDLTRRLLMKLPALAKGATGAPVRRLQALINESGGHVTVDGQFGPGTDRELRAVQSRAHLSVDGVAGERTWAALLGVTL
jgi:hypothetical protein